MQTNEIPSEVLDDLVKNLEDLGQHLASGITHQDYRGLNLAVEDLGKIIAFTRLLAAKVRAFEVRRARAEEEMFRGK